MIASGGWCGPADLEYHHEPIPLQMPDIRARRDGFRYDLPTPAERRANDALRVMVNRIVDRMARQRAAVVDAACLTALAEGWDVHVYDPPEPLTSSLSGQTDEVLYRMNYVGIAFTPAEHPVPTVHHHGTPGDWDLYDDEEDY